MEKSKRKQKPKEILELEKLYNIKLSEIKNSKNKPIARQSSHVGHCYSLNESGNICSIDVANSGIKSLDIISTLDLIELNLTNNIIEDITSISNLKNLKYLYLGGNRITNIEALKECVLIEELALWGNPIKNMFPIANLKQLINLYVQGIGFKDLSFINELRYLKELAARDNNIKNVDYLEKTNSSSVSLEKNGINTVSLKIAKKYNWLDRSSSLTSINKKLLLLNNPLHYPPMSVIELGPETVKNYYESSEKYGHAPLSEGRIIVVGDGSAGKSSLIERILNNTFDENKTQTNGIKIDHFYLKHYDDRELVFHIWDFGGQEIQHAVHKFFFTEGCLYLLVLDNRKEEEPEYWLQQIESLGGSAPVIIVFNKQDENVTEITDRKFLKEKYPNIVGFYSTSCKSGFGIQDLRIDLEKQAIQLRTVEEQFPFNWFNIKKSIEECTSGSQHYLDYSTYLDICLKNNTPNEEAQKLLLKYFTTIGAITWFGDTFLNFLHVLSPAWITQGVYKIITSKVTDQLQGRINISDFKQLLSPINDLDYTYDKNHYGYILSMMKKFDLCYTPDDITILIPSAFGKVPKVEYSDFRGESVRTYILQFKDYLPIAIIHRYIAKKLPDAYDNNYWYTGIVIKDSMSAALAMIHADREAKRIYIRIKGDSPLGLWESIRREIFEITTDYAKIPYDEMILLDELTESSVNYEDLISYLQSKKDTYFHPKLKKDFNIGYLLGFFQTQQETIEKLKKGIIPINLDNFNDTTNYLPPVYVQIVNNNNPFINTNVNVDINLEVIVNLSVEIKGEASYLINELNSSNEKLSESLLKIIQFAEDVKESSNVNDIKEKGWGRKLKGVVQTLINSGDTLKHIKEGGEALSTILHKVEELAAHFNLRETSDLIKDFFHLFK